MYDGRDPRLGAAVPPLLLEAPEEDGSLGSGDQLILYRVAERDHRPLAHQVGAQLGPAAAQTGVERPLGLVAGAHDADDRRLERQSPRALLENLAQKLDVALAVAAVTAREALGARKAVARLPHPQRGLGETGLLGHVSDRERAPRM